ncbi:MAG: uroporphyrinogen decarboxylase family protein [Planctomycetota bacterium]|nr:uroporphyrinogen decarboxylase family protein [Planctomycetota bacterium]
MNRQHWDTLLAVVAGERVDPVPVGFIIDSPWLPNWAGMTLLDYFASESRWLEANRRALDRFPEVLFLPGFWSEFGMCTEPSAFGSRPVWEEDTFPFAEPVLGSTEGIADLARPDPARHGLPPLVLKRLAHARPAIEEAGHAIRFAVARGPLNVAAFLMGSTEFLMAIKTEPDRIHTLLATVTDFLLDWLRLQAETFETIDGIFLLDDIVGFLGEDDFQAFAKPYLAKAFGAMEARVRFFHNDAPGRVCAPHLAQVGVNLFNFSHEHSLAEMKEWTGRQVALVGNIPPRDVLASGTPDDVRDAVRAALDGVEDTTRLILSCGGGMPPGAGTENIEAFVEAARA